MVDPPTIFDWIGSTGAFDLGSTGHGRGSDVLDSRNKYLLRYLVGTQVPSFLRTYRGR